MSIDTMWQITSTSAEQTEQLGEQLGQRLKGSEVIELVSDLGGGKTTFVRGLAKGLGCIANVSSPTFKICNVYEGSKLTLYHYDFYRLSDAGMVGLELTDALNEPDSIVVIEWAGVVDAVLPASRMTIKFFRTSEESRQISISCPKDWGIKLSQGGW